MGFRHTVYTVSIPFFLHFFDTEQCYDSFLGHHVFIEETKPSRMCSQAEMRIQFSIIDWVMVSNIFDFHPYLGKIPILTKIFHMG